MDSLWLHQYIMLFKAMTPVNLLVFCDPGLDVLARVPPADLAPLLLATGGLAPVPLLARLLSVDRWAFCEAVGWFLAGDRGRPLEMDWTTDWVRARPPDHRMLASLRERALRVPQEFADFRAWLGDLSREAQAVNPPDGLTIWPPVASLEEDDTWCRVRERDAVSARAAVDAWN